MAEGKEFCEAMATFQEIDINQNGIVEYYELQAYL